MPNINTTIRMGNTAPRMGPVITYPAAQQATDQTICGNVSDGSPSRCDQPARIATNAPPIPPMDATAHNAAGIARAKPAPTA